MQPQGCTTPFMNYTKAIQSSPYFSLLYSRVPIPFVDDAMNASLLGTQMVSCRLSACCMVVIPPSPGFVLLDEDLDLVLMNVILQHSVQLLTISDFHNGSIFVQV